MPSKADSSMDSVERSVAEGLPEDFYTVDLMDAYTSLGRIIGEDVDDDLVNEIFSKFCMGKELLLLFSTLVFGQFGLQSILQSGAEQVRIMSFLLC